MTQKELSYLEDAISHECIMIKVLNDTNERLKQEELKEFIENALTVHQNIKENLINLMEDKTNEWWNANK